MRALDPANIAILEEGQGTVLSVTERNNNFPSPAHFLAGVHGLAYPVCGGASAADGPADPRVRVVKGLCVLNEVEDCVFHPSTRRKHGGVLGPEDRVRSVNDDARDLRARRAP